MPERWERELKKLRVLNANESVVRERVARRPSAAAGPPRRERVIAGVVAGAVAIAAAALLWPTLPGDTDAVGDAAAVLPVLSVSFHDSEVVTEGPDSSFRRVQTSIRYGDASDESFTSTLPDGPEATVHWVGTEDLTPFVPGPTVGSRIRFEADGDRPRVLLGRPRDWPNFDAFTEIQQLPDTPGEYILVFEADYPEGIARTARVVRLVDPGVLQVVTNEGGKLDAATAHTYVDGRRTDGFLSSSWFMAGDVGGQSQPRAPTFSDDSWLPVTAGSPILLPTDAAEARAGLFPTYGDFSFNERLPLDLLNGASLTTPAGRQLLAVEVTWKHGKTGWANNGTEERALFFFPIQVVAEPTAVEEPIEPAPSPTPTAEGAVVIDLRRVGVEPAGSPSVTARFNEQALVLCASGWSLVGPDGTREEGLADCNRNDEFTAPAGTPIVVTGDHASLVLTAQGLEDRTEQRTDEVPALEPGSVVSYRFDVTWPDGSTASYGLFVTISGSDTSPPPDPGEAEEAAPALRVRCTENGAEVLTPVVRTQVDGLHVIPVDVSSEWNIGLFSAGSPDWSWWSGSDEVDDVFVLQIPVGEAAVACHSGEFMSEEDMEQLSAQASPFLLTDPNGFFTRYDPECDSSEEVEVGAHVDAVDPAHAAERIRSALVGVQAGDAIEMAGYAVEWGSRYWWRIVRDGRIVAGLIVGDQGGGVIHGWACRSSGITGDPSYP